MAIASEFVVLDSHDQPAAACVVCGNDIAAGQGVTASYLGRTLRFKCPGCFSGSRLTLTGSLRVKPVAAAAVRMTTRPRANGRERGRRRWCYAFPTFHGGVGEAIGAYARALVQVLDPDAKLMVE